MGFSGAGDRCRQDGAASGKAGGIVRVKANVIMAIAGVLRNAQDGELPLFAWTLGMRRDEFLDMLAEHFPEFMPRESLSEQEFNRFAGTVPPICRQLAVMLLYARSSAADLQHVKHLAGAIAVACCGHRPLWQDLGLSRQGMLPDLLGEFFLPLYQRNTHGLGWKRFLYSELGTLLGKPNLRPPGCGKCEKFSQCFPGQCGKP